MDAKSKANFINSVVANNEIICPDCKTPNKAQSKFCIGCGAKLNQEVSPEENKAAFAPVAEGVVAETVAAAPAEPVKKAVVYVEPESVFAQGLPSWSIEPPQVMVRRKR